MYPHRLRRSHRKTHHTSAAVAGADTLASIGTGTGTCTGVTDVEDRLIDIPP
jgi:hypothetical protein